MVPVGSKGYDGYTAGVATGSLVIADDAMRAVFGSALSLLNWDDPAFVAVRAAQEAVSEARRQWEDVAGDAMTNYLDRRSLDNPNNP